MRLVVTFQAHQLSPVSKIVGAGGVRLLEGLPGAGSDDAQVALVGFNPWEPLRANISGMRYRRVRSGRSARARADFHGFGELMDGVDDRLHRTPAVACNFTHKGIPGVGVREIQLPERLQRPVAGVQGGRDTGVGAARFGRDEGPSLDRQCYAWIGIKRSHPRHFTTSWAGMVRMRPAPGATGRTRRPLGRCLDATVVRAKPSGAFTLHPPRGQPRKPPACMNAQV
jgi:hypothetical protein